MRQLVSSLVGLTLGLTIASAGGVVAQTNPVVVELFTSQGCSSCPPADAVLGEMADRDDIIALAMHVDYWDYIGWKDTFADSAFTDRQQAYAHAAGARVVYTPQVVVAGSDDVLGSDPVRISALVADHQSRTLKVRLSLVRSDGAVTVSATAIATTNSTANSTANSTGGDTPGGGLDVHLIRYRPEATVAITRGENAGRTITYRNIVTSVSLVDHWDGKAAYHQRFPIAGDEPAVVLMQRPQAGAIVAAARVR